MSPSPPGSCQETAGFLFTHDCPRPASRQCALCAKPICAEHAHLTLNEWLCTECVRSQKKGRPGDTSSRATRGLGTDNPYLYSSYYYNGYGFYGPGAWGHEAFDPNDFTEADGGSLRVSSSTHHFEEDMGGS
jgi:hypothetical protein